MTIQRFLQKAFVGGQWYVGYRCKGELKYNVIDTPKGVWIADPMVFEANGEHYIFVEVYECAKKKAAIGYYHFENEVPVYKGIIIENDYHMSYPCVFEYNGTYYMIPETSANKSIELYRAKQFPEKWVKECNLIENGRFVDSTVMKNGDSLLMLSYQTSDAGWNLVAFDLNVATKNISKVNSVLYKTNVGRPGGYIYGDKVKLRPAQDSSKKYGEKLLIYQIDSVKPYHEHLLDEISVDKIGLESRMDRIHTYSTDELYEVVDLFVEKFDLFHGIRILRRAYGKN